ncbi:MAG: XRE family transcriptional regulator [Thermoplasmata archaeon]|nr:XRE family transcriptional regulator [Thermoplasmata archaeon]
MTREPKMTDGKQPCERIVAEILPTLRAKLALTILREYGLSQVKTAELLGVTQAAVSQYTTGRRGDEKVLKDYPNIDDEIAEMAAKLVEGVGNDERERMLCGICRMCQPGVRSPSRP